MTITPGSGETAAAAPERQPVSRVDDKTVGEGVKLLLEYKRGKAMLAGLSAINCGSGCATAGRRAAGRGRSSRVRRGCSTR